MKKTLPILIVALVLCRLSATAYDNTNAWYKELIRWGLPQFKTIDEAVSFVTNEQEFLSYHGPLGGEGWWPIVMPSGTTNSNVYVENLYGLVFAGFRKECIPPLIQLLDNDALYVRYGAYEELMKKAGRYDNSYDFKINDRNLRQLGVESWREWWVRNKDNPRLDQPPKRVYEAKEWDKGNESTEQWVPDYRRQSAPQSEP